MSEVNLPVAYKSQWDADASDTRDDCGPCSIAMILNFFGEDVTTNAVFRKTGATINSLISVQSMINAINAYGYKASYFTNQTTDQLKGYLNQGLPVIALVHYGSFLSRQDKGFSGGHFFDVVGYRDDGYFVNDPDFYSPLRKDGDHHFYTNSEFENGWTSCSMDKNPNNTFIVIYKKNQPAPVNNQAEMDQLRADRDRNWNWFTQVCEALGVGANVDAAVNEAKKLVGNDDILVIRDKQIAEANTQITDLQAQLTDLSAKHESMRVENAKLTQDLKDQTETINTQAHDISGLKEALQTLKNDLNKPQPKGLAKILEGIKELFLKT